MLAGAFAFVATAPVAAAERHSADLVAAGRAFALRVCAACHIVASGQTREPILTHPAPSFMSIAQRPEVTRTFLRRFLSSHNKTLGGNPGMPNPRLAEYQIEEVVAYILSLKK